MQTIKKNITSLELQLNPGSMQKFSSLLQNGVGIRGSFGESLGVFLSRLPGFTTPYIIDSIQTIFLNGTPIDDLETPLIEEKMVLALSAAMPGLAGAIFRRNSLHASLRGTKSSAIDQELTFEDVFVTLKLFNIIAVERGPEILNQGVLIKKKGLKEFLKDRPTLQSAIHTAIAGDTVLKKNDLLSFLTGQEDIFFIAKETDA